jgi:hypothetical protein
VGHHANFEAMTTLRLSRCSRQIKRVGERRRCVPSCRDDRSNAATSRGAPVASRGKPARQAAAHPFTRQRFEVPHADLPSPEDRSVRRRRKVLQAQHYRHQDRSIADIARLLDQAPATIKAYLYDPTGEKARATKERYRGTCVVCGAPTSGADGKGRASRHCQRCKPQSVPKWTREKVRAVHRIWHERYGFVATAYDWSGTHARRRGGAALERYEAGEWPSGPVIHRLYGSPGAARVDAFPTSGDTTAPRSGTKR